MRAGGRPDRRTVAVVFGLAWGLGLGSGPLLAVGCGDAPDPAAAKPGPGQNDPARAEPTTPAPEARPDPAPGDVPPVRQDGTIFVESELMGTRVSINLWLGTDDPAKAAAAGKALGDAVREMARLETIMSEWQPHSELSRLSDAAGGPMQPLSPELMKVLQRARQIAQATDGAFDPTFQGVGQLWSFRPGAVPPTAEAVAEKLPLVGWEDLELDPQAGTGRLARPGMRLGLGAIGKGFAADWASAQLTKAGYPNHVVEVGGDTYAAGTKDGKPWMVGIQRPGARGVVGALPSRDRAVVTSGDYQRYFEHEGTRYAHILDPRTGWPVPIERSPKSVTLVADDATDADAYCTAVAVMGVEAGMAFVEAHAELGAVIITQDDEVLVSTNLQGELVRPPAPPAGHVADPPPDEAAARETLSKVRVAPAP